MYWFFTKSSNNSYIYIVLRVSDIILWSCRTMRTLWQTRVSPNVIYSMHHLRNYTSTLAIGGIDGVLRIVDQNTGEVLSSCILDKNSSESIRPEASNKVATRKKGRRISEDTRLDLMPKAFRPSINCLAVGFQKVVTTHDDNYIRVWKFRNQWCWIFVFLVTRIVILMIKYIWTTFIPVYFFLSFVKLEMYFDLLKKHKNWYIYWNWL